MVAVLSLIAVAAIPYDVVMFYNSGNTGVINK